MSVVKTPAEYEGSLIYFAYGSNMSTLRLQARVPSASRIGSYVLKEHDLRWHKKGRDGSAKCDAYFTGNGNDTMPGVLFEIRRAEKTALDLVEGLGVGYAEKTVIVCSESGRLVQAMTYTALKIDTSLMPYSWYLHHVLAGARESKLPMAYIEKISSIDSVQDTNIDRHQKESAIHD